MGSNNLTARSDGQTVQADDVNQYRNADIGDIVPRNTSGSPEASAGSLGTSDLPWASLYLSGQIIIDGEVIDLTTQAGEAHQINSGKALSSGYPDFLTFVAASTTGRIAAATTSLVLTINNTAVTVSSNIDVTGLTTAASSNNTCLVNDSSLAGAESTRMIGEDGNSLAIGTIGSAITALDGTIQAFKKGSEYFFAYVDTTNNKLWPFKRGIAQTDRATLTHGDTITLQQGNYIFLDADGVSTYKTTIYPSFANTQPTSPTSNQWNFNTTSKRWERYSGSWSNMTAHWLGTVICDSSAAVAADANDFNAAWSRTLEGSLLLVDSDTLRVNLKGINVAGRDFLLNDYGQTIKLSVSGDRESGISESANTDYYVYIDSNLKPRFSTIAPRYRDFRLGLYHPKQYWRYLGYCHNDNSSNLISVNFDGSTRTNNPTVNPYPTGYRGSAPPVWASTSTFTMAYIRERDSLDANNITKATSTTVDMGTTGLNGIARSTSNLTGTIAYTNSSTAVTGTSTAFTTDYKVGDTIYDQTNGNAVGLIATIGSNTSITLAAAFSGTSRTGASHRRGAKVAGSKWYLYAISDGGTPGLILSNRNVAGGDTLVDLPNAGYTITTQMKFAFVLDTSGNIFPFDIGAGWPNRPLVLFKNLEFDPMAASITNALNAGTASSFTDVSLAALIPAISKLAWLRLVARDNAGSGDDFVYFRPNGDSTNGIKIYALQNDHGRVFETHYLPTDSSQIIEYNCGGLAGVAAWVNVMGYVITEV